jgi:hypothetical protein
MTFNIDDLEGTVSVYKIWDVANKKWFITPAGKNIWLTVGAVKNAINLHIGRKYKDCSDEYKIIQTINIVFREVE